MNPYKQTYTGQHVDLLDPKHDTIVLEDIAQSLSQKCRFDGHTVGFYSVAQHLVMCAQVARDRGLSLSLQRQALMHDAHEAYAGDMASPTKRVVTDYKPFERRMWEAVARRFLIAPVLAQDVIQIDMDMLMTEAHALLRGGPTGDGWPPQGEKLDIFITSWTASAAKRAFLDECHRLEVM